MYIVTCSNFEYYIKYYEEGYIIYEDYENLFSSIEENMDKLEEYKQYFKLGHYYLIKKNLDKTKEYFEKINDNNSWKYLGMNLLFKATEWKDNYVYLNKAAELDNPIALRELGIYYQDIENKEKEIFYLEKAASLGDVNSIRTLCYRYDYNDNFEKVLEYKLKLPEIYAYVHPGKYYIKFLEIEASKTKKLEEENNRLRNVLKEINILTNVI